MRLLLHAAWLLALLGPAMAAPSPTEAADCQFVLGFKALRDLIPDVVGNCLVDERHDAVTGDGLQETTAWHGKGGLLVWRKADNFTAFTDGKHTWTNGPNGLQQRLNTERFTWEPDRLLPALRNAEYRLPISFDPRRQDAETSVRLSGGRFENRDQHVWVTLIEPVTAFGDLNGDGVADAVALVAVNAGGSGVFEYAVAFVDRGGLPEQVGQEFLGDRVRVSRITIASRQVTVDMIAQGPNDPFCCPTQRVVKTLGIKVPAAGSP